MFLFMIHSLHILEGKYPEICPAEVSLKSVVLAIYLKQSCFFLVE